MSARGIPTATRCSEPDDGAGCFPTQEPAPIPPPIPGWRGTAESSIIPTHGHSRERQQRAVSYLGNAHVAFAAQIDKCLNQ